MSARYRKRPLEVDALRFTGDNLDEVKEWVGLISDSDTPADWPVFDDWDGRGYQLWVAANRSFVSISIGEWILKDELGFYPCSAQIFAKTYEPCLSAEGREEKP